MAEQIATNTIAATQYYESTVYDRATGDGFTFITLPRRALADGLSELVLERGAPSHAFIFVLFLEPSKSELVDSLDDESLVTVVGKAISTSSDREDFANFLVHEAIIPFESSPLDAKSLSEIASTVGATGALGYFGSEHPLILVTLPAGIVICGAALGVAEALREGLRYKILKLLGLRDPSEPTPEEQAKSLAAMLAFLAAAMEQFEQSGFVIRNLGDVITPIFDPEDEQDLGE